jgi:hypothetical protein
VRKELKEVEDELHEKNKQQDLVVLQMAKKYDEAIQQQHEMTKKHDDAIRQLSQKFEQMSQELKVAV